MKKMISIALATCMVGSLFAFSACGKETVNGEVKGNYTAINETNQAQFESDLTAFETQVTQSNAGGLMGDTTKAGYSYGMSLATQLLMEYNFEGEGDGKVDLNAKLGMKMYNEDSKLKFKASAEVNAKAKLTDKEDDGKDESTDATIGAKAYIADDWAYADLSTKGKIEGKAVTEAQQSMKGKVKLSAVTGALDELLGDMNFEDMGESTTELSVTEMIGALQAFGLPMSYEYSAKSGLKLKLSITQEWIEGMMAGGATPTMAQAPAVLFDACKLDLYVVLNAEGLLTQVSADVNIHAKVPDETQSGKSFVKIKGGLVFKADSSVKVNVPADLATDTSYDDYSLLIGTLVGGGGLLG